MQVNNSLEEIFRRYKPITFRKHENVLNSGDENASLYYLESGYVRSYFLTEEGWSVTLNILSPGAIFPLSQILAGIKINPHEFEAITGCKVRKVPIGPMIEHLKNNPEELMEFTKKLASGMEGLTLRMKSLIRSSAKRRILSGLDLLLKKFGESRKDGSMLINFRHTHQDIADIAGVTRETATKELLILAAAGVIERTEKLTVILDADKFTEMLQNGEEKTDLEVL